MKKLSLLIVANNCVWPSWWEKILLLKKWFSTKVDLEISLRDTQYSSFPFVEYNPDGWYGIDRAWYDQNISPLAQGFDIVLFVCPTTQWKGQKARGWRTDRDQGPIELQIAADENEHIYQNGVDLGSTFFQYGRHEIMHALFMLTGQTDSTHYWWDQGIDKLDNALAEIKFPDPHPADKPDLLTIAFAWLSSVLVWLKGPRTTSLPPIPPEILPETPKGPVSSLNAFCKAIEDFEGYFPPGGNYPSGSRSWRNRNPGNLRFVGQIGATADKQNFAVFPTYEQGFDALQKMVRRAIEGKSKVYRPDMTFEEFFGVYAPAYDSNDPTRYAHYVADKCGVPVTTKISELVLV